MRRRALLVAGVCTLLGLTGAGVAAATSFAPARPRIASVAAPQMPAQHRAGVTEPGAEPAGVLEAVTGGLIEWTASRTFTYPGADYVKVHFGELRLNRGDKVRVTDASGAEHYTYTSEELRLADNWSMSVSGDRAVVSVERAGDDVLGLKSKLAGLGVTVDRIARGQTPDERAAALAAKRAAEARQPHEESICGRSNETENAACYKSSDPVAYANSKPVARILINGVELCTAFRIGTQNRMMTNHHCLTTTREARNTEVWFNYECAQCEGGPTLRPTKVMGDQVIATDELLDYTLFSVRDFEAVQRFGYLQIDDRAPVRGEELYIPQHPRGAPTVITMQDPTERSGNCAVSDPSYDGYAANTDMSYYCDTDGGSSGSPVISRRTNKVIALHHFGGCPNSGVRMDRIAAHLRGEL
ncbi:trypsin-like peptidase domain-containing protein [Dactylosporangium roseum]|uniref:Trypsin-like peptidase domain-containing protein n=1 Tax=Dactylosporangium roseum TaxID=47989 RepID=A0ABY5Z673_9ACTN|nr:serine protease [Dactylosporangium roseum]UWZ37159.1 trypsin-like peptidase domain-containing protein [Dactylosporangium roseum]